MGQVASDVRYSLPGSGEDVLSAWITRGSGLGRRLSTGQYGSYDDVGLKSTRLPTIDDIFGPPSPLHDRSRMHALYFQSAVRRRADCMTAGKHPHVEKQHRRTCCQNCTNTNKPPAEIQHSLVRGFLAE